jgi:hypothetical protein
MTENLPRAVKAILIDPSLLTLIAVEYQQPGGLDEIYRLTECQCIDAARLNDGHAIYVDDEGSFKSNDLFAVRGFPHVLYGKGLLVGPVDDEGDTTDCVHDLEWAAKNIFGVVALDDGRYVGTPLTIITKEVPT